MGKIKKKPDDTIEIGIKPSKDALLPPWVLVFVTEYKGGAKELAGSVDLSRVNTQDDLIRVLGQIVLANSRVLKKWVDDKGL